MPRPTINISNFKKHDIICSSAHRPLDGSVGGAAGVASSTTVSKIKKQRATAVDATDSSGTPAAGKKERTQEKTMKVKTGLED